MEFYTDIGRNVNILNNLKIKIRKNNNNNK